MGRRGGGGGGGEVGDDYDVFEEDSELLLAWRGVWHRMRLCRGFGLDYLKPKSA